MNAPRTLFTFLLLLVAALGLLPTQGAAQPPTPTVLSLPTNGSPSPRYGHATCSYLGGMLLFGGHDGTQFLADTWYYNASTNTWTQINLPIAPSPRRWAKMVYHAAAARVYLFGGDTPTGDNAETWTYFGTWFQLPNGPPARSGHVMAYDPMRQVVVMYGGFNRTDTWELGLGWQQIATASNPGPRTFSSMVYDARRQVMLLHGGLHMNGTYLADTWDYSGGWLARPETTPAPVAGAAAAYDTSRQRTVLIGGLSGTGVTTSAIYEHTGTTWLPRVPPFGNAPARYGAGAAFFENLGVAVLFFGGGGAGGSVLGDTWRYFISPAAAAGQGVPGCGGPTFEPYGGSRPWLGEYWLRRALIPAPGYLVLATGFSPASIDLTSAGLTGCTLGTSAEILGLHYSLGGYHTFADFLPNLPSLQGVTFYEQIGLLQAGANPAGIVLSNSLDAYLAGK